MLPDHSSIATARSDSRITYYVTGYVARKMLSKTKCEGCSKALLLPAGCEAPKEACLTKEIDKGGLLYPSKTSRPLSQRLKTRLLIVLATTSLKQIVTLI